MSVFIELRSKKAYDLPVYTPLSPARGGGGTMAPCSTDHGVSDAPESDHSRFVILAHQHLSIQSPKSGIRAAAHRWRQQVK